MFCAADGECRTSIAVAAGGGVLTRRTVRVSVRVWGMAKMDDAKIAVVVMEKRLRCIGGPGWTGDSGVCP